MGEGTPRRIGSADRERVSKEGAGSGAQGHPTSSVALRCAGKPAARHVPVNGQGTAASTVSAEPRLQPRTWGRAPKFPTGTPSLPIVASRNGPRRLTADSRDVPHSPVARATLDYRDASDPHASAPAAHRES